MKIKGKLDYSLLNPKTLALPGLVLQDQCSNCNYEFAVDLNRYRPYVVKKEGIFLIGYSCPKCDHDLHQELHLEIKLTKPTTSSI